MQVITFDQDHHSNNMFFSPDSCYNKCHDFYLNPGESILVRICYANSYAPEHKRIKFIKRHFYTMSPGHHLCYVIRNITSETIQCLKNTSLSTLLNMVQHTLCHANEIDIKMT